MVADKQKGDTALAFCDLHTHSYYSDGSDSPAEIVAAAAELGLTAVALTDHNTIAGLAEFRKAARDTGVEAILGVEISTGYRDKKLHIVGLDLQLACFGELNDFLSVINVRKDQSNRDLIQRLNRAGYALDFDEILAKAQGTVNRAVIAARMVELGYIGQVPEGFSGILSEAAGFYVPPERINALEAVSFLRELGAVPVLAHPYLNLSQTELEAFLHEAIPAGLAAMETRYAAYTPETTRKAIDTARAFGILESGGSDYHGGNKPGVLLGSARVPQALWDRLRKGRA